MVWIWRHQLRYWNPPGIMCVCREDLVRPAVAVDIDRWSPGLSQASPTGVPPSPQSQLACSADHISIYIWRSSYPHIIISAVAVDINWWSPGLRLPSISHNLKSPAQLTTYMRIIIWYDCPHIIIWWSSYYHSLILSPQSQPSWSGDITSTCPPTCWAWA